MTNETGKKKTGKSVANGRQEEVLSIRTDLRDAHCVNGPGPPSDYKYVVSGYCRAIPGTFAHGERKKAAGKTVDRGKATGKGKAKKSNGWNEVPLEQNATEIQKIQTILDSEDSIEQDREALRMSKNVAIITNIRPGFEFMISYENRMKYPDPMERFVILRNKIKSASIKNNSDDKEGTKVMMGEPPRRIILGLVLSHLKTIPPTIHKKENYEH